MRYGNHYSSWLPHAIRRGGKPGPYEIISMVRQGGIGEIYKGLDTGLGRPVAITTSTGRFPDVSNTKPALSPR